jgi:hypothetical protein
MVETAAHLTDHVFPRLPVRQWVLSVPKRLRFLLQHDDVCVVDGVFEEVAGDCDVQAAAPGVVFHPGGGIDGGAVLEVQATLR